MIKFKVDVTNPILIDEQGRKYNVKKDLIKLPNSGLGIIRHF